MAAVNLYSQRMSSLRGSNFSRVVSQRFSLPFRRWPLSAVRSLSVQSLRHIPSCLLRRSSGQLPEPASRRHLKLIAATISHGPRLSLTAEPERSTPMTPLPVTGEDPGPIPILTNFRTVDVMATVHCVKYGKYMRRSWFYVMLTDLCAFCLKMSGPRLRPNWGPFKYRAGPLV